jgi:hypothetical protein
MIPQFVTLTKFCIHCVYKIGVFLNNILPFYAFVVLPDVGLLGGRTTL